jgi:hypothetical protein
MISSITIRRASGSAATLLTGETNMGSLLAGRARGYLLDAGRAFERAPVEVTVAVVLAIAFSWAVELGDAAFQDWAETAIAGALIIAAAWTGTLLHALGAWSRTRRWLVTGLGALGVALYAFTVLDLQREAEGWRAGMLLAAAILWLLAAPVLAGPADGRVDRVRTVAGRVLLRMIGAVLYCAALFVGLALALAAIDTLFELNLEGTIYGHVWGWIFLVLAPWIVIGGLGEYAQPVEPRSEVAGVAHRMMAFLVPPLVALYFAILYAYTIRIAVTGEVPKNLVSPLVFAAGVLAGLALFLFDPRSRGTIGMRALRVAPPLFLPLSALGIWTILLRVDQYGWTEFRLLRLVLLTMFGLLALGASFQLVRRQRFALHAALLLLSGALLLSAIGPWSTLAVARRDQQARLAAALAAAGVDATPPAPPAESRTIPSEQYDEISSAAQYLSYHFGRDALPPLLAAQATDRSAMHDLAARIGLQRDWTGPAQDRFMGGQLGRGAAVEMDGITVYRVEARAPERMRTAAQAEARTPQDRVVVVQDSMELRFRIDTESYSADMTPLVTLLQGQPERRMPDLPPQAALLEVVDSEGRARGRLLVLNVSLQAASGAVTLQLLDGLLLLRQRE